MLLYITLMISSYWNPDTAVSRFVTTWPSPLDKTNTTNTSCYASLNPDFFVKHKPFEPSPHHRVSQILFLFGRRNEMWVRVRYQPPRWRNAPSVAPRRSDAGRGPWGRADPWPSPSPTPA